MRRGLATNQRIADAISKIATTAIKSIEAVSKGGGEDMVTDGKGFDKILRPQEGVFPRQATLLGPQSEERYVKGKPIRDGQGRYRPSDAKG
jgi:hypothetical protein